MTVETRFSESDKILTISVDGDFSFALLHKFRNAYSSKEAALILAEKLRQNIELLNIENKSSSISNIITISIGVTTLVPNKNTDVSTIIAQADKALYLAKDNGRNNVQYI